MADGNEPVVGVAARGGAQTATGWVASRDIEQVVFLVPGLLGFERFGAFGYFDSRVRACIRGGVQRALDRRVPVIPLPIPPVASLAERQKALVGRLADKVDALGCTGRLPEIHLVGHSTGGVDANLLSATEALGGMPWEAVDSRAPALLERLRTCISIGSPHQGACIVRDPLVQFAAGHSWSGAVGLPYLLALLGLSLSRDEVLWQFLTGTAFEPVRLARFIGRVKPPWGLVRDLEPDRPVGLQGWRNDVTRRSFVTVAGSPRGRRRGRGQAEGADPFFTELSERASGVRTGTSMAGAALEASVHRLQRALQEQQVPVIKSKRTQLPGRFEAHHNDGVVNSARQLMDPAKEGELAAIVVADHFDVLGYYDREVALSDGSMGEETRYAKAGILHSDSVFRDEQFFQLYASVVNIIAESAQAKEWGK